MITKTKNILFLLFFTIFFFLTIKYYFSEKNIKFTNKSRSSYLSALSDHKNNLQVLENDTSNIIVYINDLEDLKKKKKKWFWEKLISKNNE